MGKLDEVRGRCPQDKDPQFGCLVHGDNFQFIADEGEIAGINAVASAMITLAAIMCRGVKPDYTARVALGVLSRLISTADPHMICPISAVVLGVRSVGDGSAKVLYDPNLEQFMLVLNGDDFVEGGSPPPPPPNPNDGGGILGEQVQ